MPFQRVEQEKLAQSVMRQIELLILRGILRPGERLPSERDMSERLGVSRPSLREAVADLQQRGLLTSEEAAANLKETLKARRKAMSKGVMA
jgi:GntR family transcriptional repressor for pyruvate dehydrogenase complex